MINNKKFLEVSTQILRYKNKASFNTFNQRAVTPNNAHLFADFLYLATDGLATGDRLKIASHLLNSKNPSPALKQIVMGFFQYRLEMNGFNNHLQKRNKNTVQIQTPIKNSKKRKFSPPRKSPNK